MKLPSYIFNLLFVFKLQDNLRKLFDDCGHIKSVHIVPTPKLTDGSPDGAKDEGQQVSQNRKLLEIMDKKTTVYVNIFLFHNLFVCKGS